jgi:hypothetical protein
MGLHAAHRIVRPRFRHLAGAGKRARSAAALVVVCERGVVVRTLGGIDVRIALQV